MEWGKRFESNALMNDTVVYVPNELEPDHAVRSNVVGPLPLPASSVNAVPNGITPIVQGVIDICNTIKWHMVMSNITHNQSILVSSKYVCTSEC